MIPKLIHQTAPSADLPGHLSRYVDTVRQKHPGWEYRLWTDGDNAAFVRREFPRVLGLYEALPRNIMRADVVRCLLLARFGGLYLDTDYEMLRPFDLSDHGLVLPWEMDPKTGSDRGRIANAVMASEPGHPFWAMVIDDLLAAPPTRADADVLESTGPGFITRVHARAVGAGMAVHSPPGAVFCPITPRNHRQYQAIVRGGVSYGIHHCVGSWRESTPLVRIRRAVASITNPFR